MLLWEEGFCEELVAQVVRWDAPARAYASCSPDWHNTLENAPSCAQGFYVIRFDNRDIGASTKLDQYLALFLPARDTACQPLAQPPRTSPLATSQRNSGRECCSAAQVRRAECGMDADSAQMAVLLWLPAHTTVAPPFHLCHSLLFKCRKQ
jgi:hypothetical protein